MFRLKQVTIAAIGVAVLLFVATGSILADKNIFTETYDINQPQPCEGLNLDGVAYTFTIGGSPSADCTAGTMTGPGNTNDIHTPSIEGNAAGVLHLRNDTATT